MALQITSPVTTDSGISLATSYARVTSMDPFSGNQLTPAIAVYASEDDFINGFREVRLLDNNGGALPSSFNFPYDRQTDGADTLMICHERIQTALSNYEITSVIEGLN